MAVKIPMIEQGAIDKIAALVAEYRQNWKADLWESEDSEEFGLNEFLGGKMEAFEECLDILKRGN
jgi:hypothetical protein